MDVNCYKVRMRSKVYVYDNLGSVLRVLVREALNI